MNNSFLSIMNPESIEVTVRETRNSEQDNSIEIKVLKKPVDEFGEAGGVIGTEASFGEKTFMKRMRINWTIIFFGMLGNCELPQETPPPTGTQGSVCYPLSRQQFSLKLISMNILLLLVKEREA